MNDRSRRPRQRKPLPKRTIHIIVGVVIVTVLLLLLFVPFVPSEVYEVVDTDLYYNGYVDFTSCSVTIKDLGVGGDYNVRLYVAGKTKYVAEHLEPNEVQKFAATFPGTRAFVCTYEVRPPINVQFRSVFQILTGG